MKFFAKWAIFYLCSLAMVAFLGYSNYTNTNTRNALAAQEDTLKNDLVKTSKLHFELLSPLALQEWAKNNGYIPMAYATWRTP